MDGPYIDYKSWFERKLPGKKKIIIYNCKDCGQTIVSRKIHKGTIPFLILCSDFGGCNIGMMTCHDKEIPDFLRPKYEWYRPNNINEVPEEEKERVIKGGLLIREIE